MTEQPHSLQSVGFDATALGRFLSLGVVIVSNLYLLFGIYVLSWKVSDTFFWFWFEFLLLALTTFVLVKLHFRDVPPANPALVKLAQQSLGWGSVYVFFFITLFFLMAYKGEWHSYSKFGLFLSDKWQGMAGVAGMSLLELFYRIYRKEYRYQGYSELERPLGNKMMIVALLYAVLMFQYHLTGSKELALASTGYLKFMALALVLGKMCVETGLLDLSALQQKLRRRVKA